MTLKFPLVLVTGFIMLINFEGNAQPMANADGKNEETMDRQADSLINLFLEQGFEMVRQATVAMKSQYEKPIILSLKKGTWYRVIFIADKSSKLYEIRMYDWNEKQVVYENQKPKDAGGNIINYDYIPRFTEFHMIKPLQINKKKKNVFGQMLLFKKTIKP